MIVVGQPRLAEDLECCSCVFLSICKNFHGRIDLKPCDCDATATKCEKHCTERADKSLEGEVYVGSDA
jgi:hypothetical protein